MLRRNLIKLGTTLLTVGAMEASGIAATAATAAPELTAKDRDEIQQLYATYCHALDKGLGELFASCWTEDGEFTGGRGPGMANADRTPRKGRAALTAMTSYGGTRHFTANLMLTATPEGAKGSCYLLLYTARTTPPSFVETAIYEDLLVRTQDGWKFKKRIVWRDDDDISPFRPKPLP